MTFTQIIIIIIIIIIILLRKKTININQKDQPKSAKRIEFRCEVTSSIHTDKPLTCLACLARLWVTLLPSLQT